jgi:hypothetical protein
MRSTQEMRDKLERAAAISGLSLVQEVERRLEKTFQEEDALISGFGGPSAEPFVRPALYFLEALQRSGHDWRQDPAIASAMPRAIAVIAEAVFGGGLSLERQKQLGRDQLREVLAQVGPSVDDTLAETAIMVLRILGLAEKPPFSLWDAPTPGEVNSSESEKREPSS